MTLKILQYNILCLYVIFIFRKLVTSSELSALCEMDEEELVQCMSYWKAKGVVSCSFSGSDLQTVVYEVIESQQANAITDELNGTGDMDVNRADSRLTASSDQQRVAAVQKIEEYVKGIKYQPPILGPPHKTFYRSLLQGFSRITAPWLWRGSSL